MDNTVPNTNQTLSEVIANAIKAAGFTGQIAGKMHIIFETPPLLFALDGGRGEQAKDRYRHQVKQVAGVESDEGQVEGYTFEIDASRFTLASERRLLSITKQYGKYAKSPA